MNDMTEYADQFEWLNSKIPTRLKETELTEENCTIDDLESFIDGDAVLVTYRSQEMEPYTVTYPGSLSLKVLFDDLESIRKYMDNGGAQ